MYFLLLAFQFQYSHYNITTATENLKINFSIIIRCGSDPDHTMCPPAATCGKSDRARIGTWEQIWAISARAIKMFHFITEFTLVFVHSSIFDFVK